MFKRVMGGFFVMVYMTFMFIFGGLTMNLMLMILSLIGYYELCRAFHIRPDEKKISSIECIGYISIIVIYLTQYFLPDLIYFLLTIVLTIIAFLVVFVVRFPKYDAARIAEAVFSMLYCPVMLSFIYQTRNLEYGKYFVWLILASAWLCDVFAFFAGKAFGKRKAFPALSPNKTVAGCIGGVIGATLGGVMFGLLLFLKLEEKGADCIWVFAIISFVAGVFAQFGDLAASGIKRHTGVKDYGSLIPGHGGVMDRFDSVLVTAPIVYFLAVLFF